MRLAEEFERHVRRDPRFEIPAKRHLGMVVFRLKVRLHFSFSFVIPFPTSAGIERTNGCEGGEREDGGAAEADEQLGSSALRPGVPQRSIRYTIHHHIHLHHIPGRSTGLGDHSSHGRSHPSCKAEGPSRGYVLPLPPPSFGATQKNGFLKNQGL